MNTEHPHFPSPWVCNTTALLMLLLPKRSQTRRSWFKPRDPLDLKLAEKRSRTTTMLYQLCPKLSRVSFPGCAVSLSAEKSRIKLWSLYFSLLNGKQSRIMRIKPSFSQLNLLRRTLEYFTPTENSRSDSSEAAHGICRQTLQGEIVPREV